MFEELSNRLEDALKTLRGQDKITETNIEPALKLVKKALLDADVSLSVVKDFLMDVKQAAIGQEVVRGVSPEQKFVDIVYKRLVEIMGGVNKQIEISDAKPLVVMLVGLQGAGKTTAAAKLGLYLKEKGKKVLLIAADTFRPAAREQLKTLGKQINIDVFVGVPADKSLTVAENGIQQAKIYEYDAVVVDTAGRLYIDDELMREAAILKETIQPNEVLLVVDAMIGQEAAELTKAFDREIGLTGAILTKLDGDSRGGAALSIRKVSGKPIKFIGTGEKTIALEPFYPDRLASRILGMGDILTLVDKAQKEVEIEDVISMQKKFEEASFDFTDFLKQMKLIKRMGSISGLMKLIPGMGKIDNSMLKQGETQLDKIQSMINSMTLEEQRNPQLLMKSPQRRRRVANGSGYSESDVDKVISDFDRMRGMMRNLARGNFNQVPGALMSNKTMSREASTGNSGQQLKRRETKKRKGFFEL